jgi:hypothetical protein
VTDRDYAAEMHAVVDAELAAPQIMVPLLAKDLTEKLRADQPDLLAGWLDAQAPQALADYIGRRLSSCRALARIHGRRTAFGAAAERFEAGDTSAVADWLATHYHGPRGQQHLGAFDHADLEYGRDAYAERAASNGFEAAFLGALAKKVTTGVVADFFTNEQIAAMRSSLRDA